MPRRSRPGAARAPVSAGRARSGCSHAHDERPKRLVRRYYRDVLAGRRLDVLDALVAPGFVGHDASGATLDRAAYFAAVGRMHTAFAQLEVFIDEQVAERDRVSTRWSAVGTHVGEFAGIAPTGRNVILSGIDIHRIDGDRLVAVWEQVDLATIISQML